MHTANKSCIWEWEASMFYLSFLFHETDSHINLKACLFCFPSTWLIVSVLNKNCILKIAIARDLWNSSKDQNKLCSCSCYCMKNWGFAQNNTSVKCEQICSYLFSANLENLMLHAVVTAHELRKYRGVLSWSCFEICYRNK